MSNTITVREIDNLINVYKVEATTGRTALNAETAEVRRANIQQLQELRRKVEVRKQELIAQGGSDAQVQQAVQALAAIDQAIQSKIEGKNKKVEENAKLISDVFEKGSETNKSQLKLLELPQNLATAEIAVNLLQGKVPN